MLEWDGSDNTKWQVELYACVKDIEAEWAKDLLKDVQDLDLSQADTYRTQIEQIYDKAVKLSSTGDVEEQQKTREEYE